MKLTFREPLERAKFPMNSSPITCNMLSKIDGNEPVNSPFFLNKKNKNRYETRTVFMNEFPRVSYLLKLETFG